MIRIVKASSNIVPLTLKEKTTLSNVVYLFEFTSDMSGTVKTFIAQDTSAYKDRYNRFTIVEKASNPNNLVGEVTLKEKGFHSYVIYQQTSTTNLNPASAGAIVEIGKVEVF